MAINSLEDTKRMFTKAVDDVASVIKDEDMEVAAEVIVSAFNKEFLRESGYAATLVLTPVLAASDAKPLADLHSRFPKVFSYRGYEDGTELARETLRKKMQSGARKTDGDLVFPA